MASKRIEYLDAVKGFAIFLMVFAHAIGWNVTDDAKMVAMDYSQPIASAAKGVLWRLVYSFHMPLFFMVSGYFLSMIGSELTHSEKRNKLWKQLKNKSQRLLIPYFVTGFLMLAAKGYYGYWFLFGLWEISVMALAASYVLSYVNRGNRAWIDIVAWLLFFYIVKNLLPVLPENNVVEFDRCLWCIPAFIVGILLRKFDLLQNTPPCMVLIISCLYVMAFGVEYLPYTHVPAFDIVAGIASTGMWQYMVSILGSLTVIGLFKILYDRIDGHRWRHGFCKLFEYLGLFSMEIYIIHIFLVIKLPQVGDWIISQHPALTVLLQFAYSLAITCIAVVGSVVIGRLIHKEKHISALLFGTKISK